MSYARETTKMKTVKFTFTEGRGVVCRGGGARVSIFKSPYRPIVTRGIEKLIILQGAVAIH